MIYGIIHSTLLKCALLLRERDRHKVDNDTMDMRSTTNFFLSVCRFLKKNCLSHEDFHVLRFFAVRRAYENIFEVHRSSFNLFSHI